ncbi:hypothetical protein [Acetobacter senegalensis]|uniref:hypothetical protein n=1 Tax=Acetobacter senegalensis TaxID=446692 RepID=UPI002653ADDF|nr:hypothetical protein [Acetobacter senegalensis]MDN7356322.1 hypothetical protein [Acetobacter senegalensis]
MTNDSMQTPENAKPPAIDPYKTGELIAEHVLAHENGNLDTLSHMTVAASLVIAWNRPEGVEVEASADIARRVGEGAKDRMTQAGAAFLDGGVALVSNSQPSTSTVQS